MDCNGRSHRERRGRLAVALVVLCPVVLFAFSSEPAGAASDELRETTGIRYPEGFDLNTSGEVKGRAAQLSIPEQGPVRFRLTSGRESYTVLTVPAWYWSRLEIQLSDGAEVVVRGSKTVGTDGNLYIVARELRLPASDRVISFRNRKGAPLWTGPSSAVQGSPGAMTPRGGRMGPLGPGHMGGAGGMMHPGGRR